MNDLTLESLAKRVEALEKILASNGSERPATIGETSSAFRRTTNLRGLCSRKWKPNGRRRGGEIRTNNPLENWLN